MTQSEHEEWPDVDDNHEDQDVEGGTDDEDDVSMLDVARLRLMSR